MKSKIKYLVCPDFVTSKGDGSLHFIGFNALVSLYQVNPKECTVESRGWDTSNLIHLHPRYHGDYVEWLHLQESSNEN